MMPSKEAKAEAKAEVKANKDTQVDCSLCGTSVDIGQLKEQDTAHFGKPICVSCEERRSLMPTAGYKCNDCGKIRCLRCLHRYCTSESHGIRTCSCGSRIPTCGYCGSVVSRGKKFDPTKELCPSCQESHGVVAELWKKTSSWENFVKAYNGK